VNSIDVGWPFLSAGDLLDVYLDKGGEIVMCGACWRNRQLDDAERISHIRVITAGDAVDLLMSARTSLQLN
jgi:tRNA 2-thiouridine synthesizing protein D